MSSFSISGRLINIIERRIYPATIVVADGIVVSVTETEDAPIQYLLPGFVDAHVHIESSMLIPTEFARLAVMHGTVATISDPHEIANVCGIDGINYMIDNSRLTPFKIFFGAPSCVPATTYETAGAVIDAPAVERLLNSPDIWYLSEMMNYPGVLHNEQEVIAKIHAAQKANKPVDGHAPGLMGGDAINYINAGISTDHECFTLDEALGKLNAGMHILIREGSAAKNFEALSSIIETHPSKTMFCSDDKHPDELIMGHINQLVKGAIAKGYDIFNILQAACINPVLHYNIPVGLLRVNDPADFIVVDDLSQFNIIKTYIDGNLVAENGATLLNSVDATPINNFNTSHRSIKDFAVTAKTGTERIRVIEALEGQLITNEIIATANIVNGFIEADIANDILKIAVVNRYNANAPLSIGFIKNFGLKHGAIASTIAHDCHNIIAVGVDDRSICKAVNALIDSKGGIAVATADDNIVHMPLPVAGLMTTADGYETAALYKELDSAAKELGSTLSAPFMTLSFMALLVIPSLKLSDKGLFDGHNFSFTTLPL